MMESGRNPTICTTKTVAAWYDGSSLDIDNNIWIDISGSNNHGIISGEGIGYFDALDQSNELYIKNQPVVYGTTTTYIDLGESSYVELQHTVFNLCKYIEDGTKRRIIESKDVNALFGFWEGKSGVAYESGWLTQNEISQFGNNWVLSSQQTDLYRGNGIDLTTGSSSNVAPGRLTINNGHATASGTGAEMSDFACAEILIYNEELNVDEIECVEQYFDCKYDLSLSEGVACDS